MRHFRPATVAILLCAWAAFATAQAPLPLNAPEVTARAEALLKQLTLPEKIALLAGHDSMFTHGVPDKGIPELKMSDASVGVRVWGPSTSYPASAALAATWDPQLAYREGRSIGRDARARGVHIVLGPGMDIVREPQGGRNFEYLGEDPELAGQLAVGWIRGLQGEGVAACAKHYAGNEQETHRVGIDTIISKRALEEIYLAPFRVAVERANLMTIMAAYNKVNGEYAAQNKYLLSTVLRDRWNFKGLVMSDWGATHSTLPSLEAGLDLEMPSDRYYNAKAILPLLRSGQLGEANLDQHVLRLLRVMVAMHFLDRPQNESSIPTVDPASAATAEQVEAEAAVLLKNKGGILPLDRAAIHRIVVVGPDASPAVTGAGGSSFTKPNLPPVSLLDAVRQIGGSGMTVQFLPYPFQLHVPRGWPPQAAQSYGPLPPLSARQQAAIRQADVVIAAMGPREEEGADRGFELPAHQNEYLRAVAALNPRTIVVMDAGDSVAMTDWLDRVAGLLWAWYPGENGNLAVARILFGDLDPSGHLPDTFEKRWQDDPAYGHFPGHDGRVDFAEGVFVGYRWFDSKHIQPLFPFGFGLSYTTFSIAHLRLASSGAGKDRMLTAAVDITNTGRRAGADVVQLYVRPAMAPVPRPFQELRGFARVVLQPGQTQQVTIPLRWNDFAYFDAVANGWRVPAGTYRVAAGDSSRNISAVVPVVWKNVASAKW